MRPEHWLFTIPLRLRSLFRGAQADEELDDELRDHLERKAEEYVAKGMTQKEAHRRAQLDLGGIEQTKEKCRDARRVNWIQDFVQDSCYGVRILRKSPAFTTVAVLTLALGIGANSAIFSLLNTVVLRLLPVRDPQQLVEFTYTGIGDWNSYFGYPQLERFRSEAKTLSGIFGGTGLGRVNLVFHGTANLAEGEAYTDNFFNVLGVTPEYGRLFADGDDLNASVAVLSDQYWRLRLGADSSVVGETITIDQIPFTIAGIAPQGFSGIRLGSAPDLWVPLHALDRFKPDPNRWKEPFTSWLMIAGRLQSGVTRAQAQAELDVIHRRLLAQQLSEVERPGQKLEQFVRESHLVLRPADNGLYSGMRAQYALPLRLLMSIAGGVLLIACANLANLLLARASGRRREIAVRLGLGAGRGRVIRQLLTESVLLAFIGGAVALLIAWWGSAVLVRMISSGEASVPLDVRPDWVVFGVTAGVSLAAVVLFGIAPALRSTHIDPGPALKEGAGQATPPSRALNRVLVVAQVALSIVLVTGAGLFVRTLKNLWSVDMGYDRENVLLFSVDPRLTGYVKGKATSLFREILQRLEAVPDVQSVSLSRARPADDQLYLVGAVHEIDGRKMPEHESIRVAWNLQSPGYFSTMKMPILLGRDFDLRDDEKAPKVVVINESLANRALPGQDPLGHRLRDATIIGVVKDSRYGGARDKPRPVLYQALLQSDFDEDTTVEVRHLSGTPILQEVRREIASVDRNLPIFRIASLQTQTEILLLRERLLAAVSGFFGALALLLACVGLYGLMAYTVTSRIAEIGVRMALGAPRGRIMWLVLGEALTLSLVGVVVGVPVALWAAKYAKTLLFGVSTGDPVTISVSVIALACVAIFAGYLPAHRASRVDPMVALRYE